MVAAVEHGAREPEGALGRAGHPGRDRLHPAPEGLLARALDEQVQVVALHGVVHDAEAAALAGLAQARAQLAQEAAAAEARRPAAQAQRDVRGTLPRHRRAAHVMDGRVRGGGRTPRAGPRPASPGAHPVVAEAQLLRSALHRID